MNRFSTLAPTPSLERITALDVLRGFAVLGILLMNIQSFSMIMAAYMNPTAYGNLQGVEPLGLGPLQHIRRPEIHVHLLAPVWGGNTSAQPTR